jgi:hypothetical protein
VFDGVRHSTGRQIPNAHRLTAVEHGGLWGGLRQGHDGVSLRLDLEHGSVVRLRHVPDFDRAVPADDGQIPAPVSGAHSCDGQGSPVVEEAHVLAGRRVPQANRAVVARRGRQPATGQVGRNTDNSEFGVVVAGQGHGIGLARALEQEPFEVSQVARAPLKNPFRLVTGAGGQRPRSLRNAPRVQVVLGFRPPAVDPDDVHGQRGHRRQ